MQHNTEFARFRRRRELLNARLDSSRAELDAWLTEHSKEDVPSTVQLAHLEGLLAGRSNLFAQLKALDDSFVEYIFRLRRSGPWLQGESAEQNEV